MTKIHYKPQGTKAKPNDIGKFNSYKLDEVGFELSEHFVVGSKETIPAAEHDRLMIVIRGFANTTDESKPKQVIRDGSVVEIKAGEAFEYQGQMHYYLVS